MHDYAFFRRGTRPRAFSGSIARRSFGPNKRTLLQRMGFALWKLVSLGWAANLLYPGTEKRTMHESDLAGNSWQVTHELKKGKNANDIALALRTVGSCRWFANFTCERLRPGAGPLR